MKYLTLQEISKLNTEDARKYVDDAGNAMLGASRDNIKKIKNYFIGLLREPSLYSHFSFSEISYFFINESEHFSDEEKEEIISAIYKNFEEFCNAKNDMVPFTILDFIIREVGQKVRKKYAYLIRKRTKKFSREELRCIDIIENGFSDFQVTTYD